MLATFKRFVDEYCSPIVWHLHTKFLLYKNDSIIEDKVLSKTVAEVGDGLIEAGRKDVLIGDAFIPLEKSIDEILGDECWIFDYKGSFSTINPSCSRGGKVDLHFSLNEFGGNYYTDLDEDVIHLPESLGFSLNASLIVTEKKYSCSDSKMYRIPAIIMDDSEDNNKNSVRVAVLPLIKLGRPLDKGALSRLSLHLNNLFEKDISKGSVIGITEFNETDNVEGAHFHLDDNYVVFTIGKVLGSYLNRNPDVGFDFCMPDRSSYIRISKDNIYRPLGFDCNIINYVSESLGTNVFFDYRDMCNEPRMPDLLSGLSKGMGVKIKMLGCFQDNLIKQEEYIYDEGLYLNECPEYELFPKAFFYTKDYDDFVSQLPLSSCHNVYFVSEDNDNLSYIGLHVFGFNKESKCVLNVVYYDDSLIEFNKETERGLKEIFSKISKKISGTIKIGSGGNIMLSSDDISHGLLCIQDESEMNKKIYLDELQ